MFLDNYYAEYREEIDGEIIHRLQFLLHSKIKDAKWSIQVRNDTRYLQEVMYHIEMIKEGYEFRGLPASALPKREIATSWVDLD